MLAGAARGSVEGFQRIFLSWNYWDLEERAASSGGVNEELEDLPQSFNSAEVRAISCRNLISCTRMISAVINLPWRQPCILHPL